MFALFSVLFLHRIPISRIMVLLRLPNKYGDFLYKCCSWIYRKVPEAWYSFLWAEVFLISKFLIVLDVFGNGEQILFGSVSLSVCVDFLAARISRKLFNRLIRNIYGDCQLVHKWPHFNFKGMSMIFIVTHAHLIITGILFLLFSWIYFGVGLFGCR